MPERILQRLSLSFKVDRRSFQSMENKSQKHDMETLLGLQTGSIFHIHSCACPQRIGLRLSLECIEHRGAHGFPTLHLSKALSLPISVMLSSIGRQPSGRTRMA